MSAPDPAKIQKFREDLHLEWCVATATCFFVGPPGLLPPVIANPAKRAEESLFPVLIP